MNVFLERFTQQAINYAIRSGLTVTGGFALRECSRLLQSTPRSDGKADLVELQSKLESKIRIISPAIDMIELIAARGNTSLESAVSLTKSIRLDIQALGIRLASAANEEELVRRQSSRAKPREHNRHELHLIVAQVRKLLATIEDAVPLINLAITTSGVKLTTNLPATISPSRLLQASTFLTAADSCYAGTAINAVQAGPTFTLSMYMLFAGHTNRPHDDAYVRETTWKEVIHKARVKLVRVPLENLYGVPGSRSSSISSDKHSIPAESRAFEFGYQLLLVEDLDDGRVHTNDATEGEPGPYDDTPLAGIRDVVPIHQISKIFYADTGKILDIGSDGEVNSPVLLLRRDVHAVPPRRMLERQIFPDADSAASSESGDAHDGQGGNNPSHVETQTETDDEDQAELDAQLRCESTDHRDSNADSEPDQLYPWCFPPDLDPEWIALEVFREDVDSSEDDNDDNDDNDDDNDDDDDDHNETENDANVHGNADDTARPLPLNRSSISGIVSKLTDLDLNITSASPQGNPAIATQRHIIQPPITATSAPVKTSLSSLEMLIRLTALQQFKQASHLTIEDELLNFFLEDSANTGAGSDAERRQQVRHDARRRVGFDPFDESPMRRRGEAYQEHARATPEPSWSRRGSVARSIRERTRRSDSVRSTTEWSSGPEDLRSSPSPSMSARQDVRATTTEVRPARTEHFARRKDRVSISPMTGPSDAPGVAGMAYLTPESSRAVDLLSRVKDHSSRRSLRSRPASLPGHMVKSPLGRDGT